MTIEEPSFPYFTWDCADELEGRLKKTLYHGGKTECMPAVSPVALTDLAVSMYVAAAPSPKRKLSPGYIGSISKRLSINPCTMILGILYCERLRQINPAYLAKISSSDLFVVSLVVASKFMIDEGEDDEIFNDEWAEAGGLGVSTVNRLEREFLDAMQWKAYVSPKDFLKFCNRLEISIALKHGLHRGWFSYTDLTSILAQIQFIEAIKMSVQKMLQVVVGCTLMYSLSISVIFSTILCLTTVASTKHLAKSHSNGIPDVVHPFADRKITRSRQIVDTESDTDANVSFQCQCTGDARLQHATEHPMIQLNSTGKHACSCPQMFQRKPPFLREEKRVFQQSSGFQNLLYETPPSQSRLLHPRPPPYTVGSEHSLGPLTTNDGLPKVTISELPYSVAYKTSLKFQAEDANANCRDIHMATDWHKYFLDIIILGKDHGTIRPNANETFLPSKINLPIGIGTHFEPRINLISTGVM